MADDGRINEKLVARLARKDCLAKLESAVRTYPTEFHSPDVKRIYLRFFDVTSLNVHLIQVIARLKLPEDVVGKTEQFLREEIEKATKASNEGIDQAEALFVAHGITRTADYLAKPLKLDVRIISPITNKFLQLLVTTDQLLSMLDTLMIEDVITSQQYAIRRSMYKKPLRRIASSARVLAAGLRKRMNAVVLEQTSLTNKGPEDVVAKADSVGVQAKLLPN